jgi:hypothetical protein
LQYFFCIFQIICQKLVTNQIVEGDGFLAPASQDLGGKTMCVVRLRIVAALDCRAPNKRGDKLPQLFGKSIDGQYFMAIQSDFGDMLEID